MRYSIFSLARNAFSRHEHWPAAWRSPEPKQYYDVVIVGGGGHGLATAYYLAALHGTRNVAVLEKGWLGGGNTGRNTTIYVTHDQVEAMTLGERIVLMNDGVIQQVGTARQIYEEPQSIFVAGFIGAPPMNMLDGELSRNGSGQLCAQFGDRQLELPGKFAASYGKQLDKPVVLGLRPEHISGSNGRDPDGSGIQVPVRPTVVEMLGEYILAYFEFGGTLLTAKLDPDVDCRVNETIELTLNLDKMHLFEPETGRVIPPGNEI